MSRDDRCGGGSVFFAFLFGAIVGAGVAAVLTPTTGPENRRRLNELKDEILEKSSDLSDTYGETKESLDETVERGKDFIKKQKNIISTAIEAGKEAYNREREDDPAEEV